MGLNSPRRVFERVDVLSCLYCLAFFFSFFLGMVGLHHPGFSVLLPHPVPRLISCVPLFFPTLDVCCSLFSPSRDQDMDMEPAGGDDDSMT